MTFYGANQGFVVFHAAGQPERKSLLNICKACLKLIRADTYLLKLQSKD